MSCFKVILRDEQKARRSDDGESGMEKRGRLSCEADLGDKISGFKKKVV